MIKRKKQDISLEELCQDIPTEFISFMESVRAIGFEEKPDYE